MVFKIIVLLYPVYDRSPAHIIHSRLYGRYFFYFFNTKMIINILQNKASVIYRTSVQHYYLERFYKIITVEMTERIVLLLSMIHRRWFKNN